MSETATIVNKIEDVLPSATIYASPVPGTLWQLLFGYIAFNFWFVYTNDTIVPEKQIKTNIIINNRFVLN